MKLTSKNLDQALEDLRNICFEVGEILLNFQKQRQKLIIEDKGVEGLATQADKKAEEFIKKALLKKYPDITFLAEESSTKNDLDNFQKQKLFWAIDPLDGTNNFINGIPIYAVSIGLMSKTQPIAGVVYNPLSGECFFGAKNRGAYFVDFRVNPLKKIKLEQSKSDKKTRDCIFAPAPSYEKTKTKFEAQIDSFKKNILGARAVRRFGCASLEICYVAQGGLDGYWQKGLKPWDTAAASIICSEAGVKLTDFFGQAYHPFMDSILAARENLHSIVLGKISSKTL